MALLTVRTLWAKRASEADFSQKDHWHVTLLTYITEPTVGTRRTSMNTEQQKHTLRAEDNKEMLFIT